VGVVEEGTEFNLAGSCVGSGQSMQILARWGLSAVVNGVELPKTGLFMLPAFGRYRWRCGF